MPLASRSAQVIPIAASGAPPKHPVKVKKRKRAAPSFPSVEEIQRFFKGIVSVRDRAIFRIMYHAGCRASEIGIIELRDYSQRTERLFINRLKGSNSGEHHLCREESRALRAWLKERGNQPGPIFTSSRGSPISRKMLDVLVKGYALKAGLPPKLRHCHMFKHACCTHLLDKGFNIEQVQDWVGLANIQNATIYGKVSNQRRNEMGAMLKDWK